MQLTGIHHLTAISAAIRDNYRFYTRTLGIEHDPLTGPHPCFPNLFF